MVAAWQWANELLYNIHPQVQSMPFPLSYIALNKNHIVKPAVIAGHFVWRGTQSGDLAHQEFLYHSGEST